VEELVKDPCPVCQGERRVRLPLRYPVSASAFMTRPNDELSPPREAWREYPCPECCGRGDVVVVSATTRSLAVEPSPRYEEAVRFSAVAALSRHLLERGLIKFDYGVPDGPRCDKIVVATVGVVTRDRVERIEAQVAERQFKVAEAIVSEARSQVSNWGSAYGAQAVTKSDVYRMIDDALRVVRAGWSKAREAER
jgi:hypothetical protein